jgi:hypothetical protein
MIPLVAENMSHPYERSAILSARNAYERPQPGWRVIVMVTRVRP